MPHDREPRPGLVINAYAYDDVELSRAYSSLVDKGMAVDAKSCPGPVKNNAMTGIPGNAASNTRCQIISIIVNSCLNLAMQSASFHNDMQSNKAYADRIQRDIDTSTRGDRLENSAGLLIAEQTPDTVSPVQLLNNVYETCMRISGQPVQ